MVSCIGRDSTLTPGTILQTPRPHRASAVPSGSALQRVYRSWHSTLVLFYSYLCLFVRLGTITIGDLDRLRFYSPIEAYWTFPVVHGYCINERLSLVILAALNTLSEFIVACLPLPIIFRQLQISKAQRWSVISLLCLGFLVVIIGVARTYVLWYSYSRFDPSWYAAAYWMTSAAEVDTALVSRLYLSESCLFTSDRENIDLCLCSSPAAVYPTVIAEI
jgi:hypothetical protein